MSRSDIAMVPAIEGEIVVLCPTETYVADASSRCDCGSTVVSASSFKRRNRMDNRDFRNAA